MKKIQTLLLAAGLLMAMATQATAQKVGFTNVELILSYMPETQAIDKELQTLEKKLLASLETKQQYYQTKMLEYMESKEAGTLDQNTEATMIQELQKLEGEIQRDLQAAEMKMLQRRMELLKPVQDKMQKAIDEVAKEGGYDYILNNTMGSGLPTILYGQEGADVSEKIAKKLGIDTE